MDLISRTIGKKQLISSGGRSLSKWKKECIHRYMSPLFNNLHVRFFSFEIIAENQDERWLRLETELENVTLVCLPSFPAQHCSAPIVPLLVFNFPPFGTTPILFPSWFHDGAEMPINRLANSRTASPIYISLLGCLPEHRLRHMNYYRRITAVSTFHSIQLPIIIFLADNAEILNSLILLK